MWSMFKADRGSRFGRDGGSISKWNTKKVTDMGYMFAYADEFNEDLNEWDVGRVTYMNRMFYGSKFNGDISAWNVSNVETMEGMFRASPFNHDIDDWDVGFVSDF